MRESNTDLNETIDSIDVYSPEGLYLGAKSRKAVHDEGLLHYSIHCWVWTEEDDVLKVLFQKRKQNKRLFPGKFDVAAAGHYLSGEYGRDGLRELVEELGIPLSLYDITYYDTKPCKYVNKDINNKELCNIYFCHLNTSYINISFDHNEIDDIIIGNAVDYLDLFSGSRSEITVRSLRNNADIILPLSAFISEYSDYFIETINSIIKRLNERSIIKSVPRYYSFVMLKPDAIERRLVPQIVSYLITRGLCIEQFDIIEPEDKMIYMHYAERIDEEGDLYKKKAYKYFHGKTVVPIVVSSELKNVIQYVRELIGYKDPRYADRGSIRGRWGIDTMELSELEGRCCENLIHACDSDSAFKKEVTLWFKRSIAEPFLL